MCQKVSEAKRKDKRSGRLTDSPNKWQAIYILGQIHHSLGQAAAAIREYTRVEDRFVDARQAIDYFARKAIQLPEVASFRPGEQVQVKLDFRNVVSCDVTGGSVVEDLLLRFSGKTLRAPQSNYPRISEQYFAWHKKEVFKSPPRYPVTAIEERRLYAAEETGKYE